MGGTRRILPLVGCSTMSFSSVSSSESDSSISISLSCVFKSVLWTGMGLAATGARFVDSSVDGNAGGGGERSSREGNRSAGFGGELES